MKKFKAWDKKWGRWIDPKDICVYGDGTADFTRRGENGDKIEIVELLSGEIELLQYSERDDKNGEELYEGDIADIRYEGGGHHLGDYTPCICEFMEIDVCNYDRSSEPELITGFIFKQATYGSKEFSFNNEFPLNGINPKGIEKIGNRFENPELLKKK